MTESSLDAEFAISPSGDLCLDSQSPGQDSASQTRRAATLRRRFHEGLGHGLLHLASSELTAELVPSLAFGRELGKLYMSDLCSRTRVPKLGEICPPADELAALAGSLPPMRGAEYVTLDGLVRAWCEVDRVVCAELADFEGSLHDYVHTRNAAWHGVGRVTLHLAEQKNNPLMPFAFVATYAERMGEAGKVRHVPLGRAVDAYREDRELLLRILRPVQTAAQRSAFLKELSDSGEILHPLSWTADDALAFLRAIPDCEAAGLVVRLPDWWNGRKPSRVQVLATVGSTKPSALGMQAMLDFNPTLSLEGEPLNAREQRELLSGARGLRLIKGRWVEVDPEQLRQALAHFEAVRLAAESDGLSFAEGMRLLAGAEHPGDASDPAADAEEIAWSGVKPGAWLGELLEQLSRPQAGATGTSISGLRCTLRPYQREGVAWLRLLARLGLGGCLADDMGLGKTIQLIALLLVLRADGETGPHLLVVPASLLGNWKAEMARFAPTLKLVVAHRSEMEKKDLDSLEARRLRDIDVVMTTYGTLTKLTRLRKQSWGVAVLDEAQAIKNPGTRQTRAVKSIDARMRFALTGTPVENRLGDVWSLFDFLCPGLLGSAQAFKAFARRLAGDDGPGYAPLRRLLRPYLLRRLKTDPTVVPDLPDKTEVTVYCGLTGAQATLYQAAVTELAAALRDLDGIQRRGAVLAFLMRFKQICNHPSQWTGDGDFSPTLSGKCQRLQELAETIASRQEKVLVFTQFRQMTGPLASLLEGVFDRPGLILHGQTAVKRRQGLVDEFQADDGPPFFVLSLKAGGTGLNLTAATHVVHFDRWWNPAVESQATDRAFRIGQRRNVMVHAFVCRGTIEERIDAMLTDKKQLADEVLRGGADTRLTEMDADELVELVSLDVNRAGLQ